MGDNKDEKGHLKLSLDLDLPLSFKDVMDIIKEVKGWSFKNDG